MEPAKAHQKRTKRIDMMLTEEEKKAAEGEAQRLGMTLSAWIRFVIRPQLGMDVAHDGPRCR